MHINDCVGMLCVSKHIHKRLEWSDMSLGSAVDLAKALA